MIELRPVREEDFAVLLDLANQAVPFAPRENAEWLEYRKAFDESKLLRRHYLALDSATAVGYGCIEEQGGDPRVLRVYVVCSPENLEGEVGAALLGRLLEDAKALGATTLWAREFEADEPARKFFSWHGFVETRRVTLEGLPMVFFELSLGGASDR